MSLARGSVLVVDDDAQVRETVARLLRWEGYDVVEAADGQTAVDLARERRFHVAVTDLLMPGMTGTDTLSALRQLDGDLVVIVMTGYGTLEAALDCLRRGAWEFLEKPFDPEQLRLLLERAMRHRELQGAVDLYEASQALLTSLSTAELRGRVLDMARRVLRTNAAVLLLEKEDGEEWELHAAGEQCGAAREVAAALTTWHGGAPRTAAGPLPSEEGALLAGGRWAHYAMYPMVVRERGVGILVGLRPAGAPPFTAIDERSGAIFAAQAALALDNARIYATLEALSVIDELTGLHSRRYLFDTVRRSGHQEHAEGTSFLMVDVDHFKQVNDTFGHSVGDRVLRRVADLLLTATRDSDIVARVGGEEFAVLLPGTDEQTATEVAERIRATIGAQTSNPTVTVSVGVASVEGSLLQEGDDPLDRTLQLMERADLALYRAKGAGRNRVCVWRARHRREPAPSH